jgi:hypothetical protein
MHALGLVPNMPARWTFWRTRKGQDIERHAILP